ncbi:MAG: hypothetical protein AB7K37_12240 [Cyclobacteriaceae bacterium]
MTNPSATSTPPFDHRGPEIEEAPVRARPDIDLEALFSIHPELLNDSYMYVHCHFNNTTDDMLIRVWRTTFVIDRQSSARSQLIHAENITYAPLWTMVPGRTRYSFLLIFGGLAKSCRVFDLVEEIAQPGGFHVSNIPRNDKDVYHVNIL